MSLNSNLQLNTYDLEYPNHSYTFWIKLKAGQLKSRKKNYNPTAALLGFMILLRFNTIKSYIYLKKMQWTNVFIG